MENKSDDKGVIGLMMVQVCGVEVGDKIFCVFEFDGWDPGELIICVFIAKPMDEVE